MGTLSAEQRTEGERKPWKREQLELGLGASPEPSGAVPPARGARKSTGSPVATPAKKRSEAARGHPSASGLLLGLSGAEGRKGTPRGGSLTPWRIVVEPHADDAFLSLGGHLDAWRKAGDATIIVTVFSGTRKRSRDAQDYARAVDAAWYGLGLIEGLAGEAEIKERWKDWVARIQAWRNRGLVTIYLPLAIRHPEHKMVRNAIAYTRGESKSVVQFYLDQPYAATQSNGPEVVGLLEGKIIASYLKPHAKKYRHFTLFKDQAKFFHFNPPAKLVGNIELIVRAP